jgi:hypothetical protein
MEPLSITHKGFRFGVEKQNRTLNRILLAVFNMANRKNLTGIQHKINGNSGLNGILWVSNINKRKEGIA